MSPPPIKELGGDNLVRHLKKRVCGTSFVLTTSPGLSLNKQVQSPSRNQEAFELSIHRVYSQRN